jgi:O-succinylbenzoic acid--CoA ligase
MARLVALDLPGGPAFVEALQRVWDHGDAAFPLDRRLPAAARAGVLAAMAPAAVVDHDGEHALEPGRPVESGDALVVATSGSTGAPKGVVLTHAAVAASAEATSTRLGVTADDHWLACLPLAHVGGLSVVTRALHLEQPLTVHDGFDPEAVTAAAREGATLVSLVATALGRIDPAVFRTIVLGGGRPPESLPANVVTTYGMTETGSGVVYDGIPLDGVEVRITDDGEIQLRGPMLLRAYRDGTCPLDADGWLPTGDAGAWEADGRLVVHGRRGEMIITGGENVWPQPLEQVLAAAPGVGDVAVTGAFDAEWGQRVVAIVVPADPASPPTLDQLRAHAKTALPAFCAPRELRLVSAIPRTALGKPRRDLLGG